MTYNPLTAPYAPAIRSRALFHWLGHDAHDIARWADEQRLLMREADEELPDG